MLRIRDILVRIRIRGSVHLTNGSGSRSDSGSCYFHHQPSRWQLFAYYQYFLKLHLHHFSKIKSHKEVTKQNSRNQGFSYYFSLMLTYY
jgi:hypothetical protein